MIPLEKLRAVTHLVTHANCPDGIASALIIKDALPDVRVSFVHYGTEEHRLIDPAPGMLFCDFSPWLPKLTDPRVAVVDGQRSFELTDEGVLALREGLIKQWRDAGVIVLDHHAPDVVAPYGELGVFGENGKLESGAWLAYEHVWKPLDEAEPGEDSYGDRLRIQEFARLAAVRDTWAKQDSGWQDACRQAAELLFWPFEHLLWNTFASHIYPLCETDLGQRLLDKQIEAAQRSLDESHLIITSKGTEVCMFQGVSTTSDAAELIERAVEKTLHEQVGPSQPDIVVGFHYRVDGGKLQLQFSCRSHTGYDCQAFARAHGGNGHKAAAGFTVEVSPEVGANPYAVFRLLLSEFEEGS